MRRSGRARQRENRRREKAAKEILELVGSPSASRGYQNNNGYPEMDLPTMNAVQTKNGNKKSREQAIVNEALSLNRPENWPETSHPCDRHSDQNTDGCPEMKLPNVNDEQAKNCDEESREQAVGNEAPSLDMPENDPKTSHPFDGQSDENDNGRLEKELPNVNGEQAKHGDEARREEAVANKASSLHNPENIPQTDRPGPCGCGAGICVVS